MGNLRASSPTKIYRLTSKGRGAGWIVYAVIVASTLLLKFQAFGRGTLPAIAIFGLMIIVTIAFIAWRLKEPHARIQTDGRGIAQFDAANNEVCTIEWIKATSYGAMPTH